MEEFKNNFLNVVKNHYFDPNGRARRKEYWQFVAVNFLISIVLTILGMILGSIAGVFTTVFSILSTIVSLGLFLPGITLAIRRLHDVNKSGWFLLVVLIPILGFLYLIYLFVTEGDKGPNQYGEDPKA